MLKGDLNENNGLTYIVKTRRNQVTGRFSNRADAESFIRAVSTVESRKEYLTWLVSQMYERKVLSPSDIPEELRTRKQNEMIDLYEKRFRIEVRKTEGTDP